MVEAEMSMAWNSSFIKNTKLVDNCMRRHTAASDERCAGRSSGRHERRDLASVLGGEVVPQVNSPPQQPRPLLRHDGRPPGLLRPPRLVLRLLLGLLQLT
jgi:hypothetical protein